MAVRYLSMKSSNIRQKISLPNGHHGFMTYRNVNAGNFAHSNFAVFKIIETDPLGFFKHNWAALEDLPQLRKN